jgi:Arc/MetJ-type ribon-helix-helix transcriptional regulator
MNITLTAEQQRWLESEVAAGRIASVEEGVRLAVDLMMPAGETLKIADQIMVEYRDTLTALK